MTFSPNATLIFKVELIGTQNTSHQFTYPFRDHDVHCMFDSMTEIEGKDKVDKTEL